MPVAKLPCERYDPEIWFPVSDKKELSELAVAYCYLCPIRLECLDRALTTNQLYGIWGGKTAAERQHMLRRGERIVLT